MNTKRLVVILFSTLLGLALIPLWMWLVGPPPVAFAVPSVYENQEVGNTSPSSTHTVCPSGIPTCGFSTVQEAVDAASDGNTIKVATGVYTGVSARNGVTQVVYISKSITVRGGYTTDFTDPPDPEANPTTLDAQDQGRVIYITGDISVTISGLNITGGDLQLEGTPPLLDYSGGGIFVITATVTLTNNHIYSNTAFRGGGFFLYNSPNAAIIKNTITGNTVTGGASRGGGGVFYLSAGGVVDENLIKNNRAEPTGGGEKHYGGIYFYNSADIVMSNNTIIDNYAANFCGGISFNNNSDNAFIFGNNFANNSSGFGGFVDADGGALCITSSMNTNILANIFTDNSSNTYGGAINISNSTVTLTGNTVVSNTASKGGGIAIQSSDVVLVGNVISGNLSSNHTHPNFNGDGGGLYIRNSEINFTNIVIADNQAERIGSGVFITDTVLHAQHTTIARNSGGDGSGIYLGNNNDTSTAVITNTILVSHTVGITVEAGNTATLNGVLWFGNTSDTGGTGAINITNDHVGNPAFAVDGYHLTDNSTAIDLGIDTNVTNDVDDEPRPVGDGYDLGADEFFVSAVVTLEVDTSSFVGFVDVYVTDTRVLATGAMTINLEALNLDGYNAASLRVYTINDPGDPGTVRQGMVGQSVPTQTVPFKVWTPNFGLGIDDDGDGAPDVDNDLNWKDITQTVWLYAFDKNEPITETVEPWNHPLFNYTDLFKWSEAYTPTPSSLNLHEPLLFALVLEGKAQPQDYSTQVYIEFALSEDLGDTFITYTVPVTLNVVLNDADPTVNLSVDTTGFTGFPDLDPWPQRVLAPGHITLTLSAYGLYPYDAATIRVYTKNAPDDPNIERSGLVGNLNPDWTVPFKVWTPNFGLGIDGDGDGIPDINNDINWRDNEQAVWVFGFDWNQPVTETWWSELPPTDPFYDPNCAWCYPLFNYTDLFKWSDHHPLTDTFGDPIFHLPQYLELTDRTPQGGTDQRVPLYFAADFTDAFPQTYSTTLYIEFAFSDDKGDTIAQTVIETITISATIPGDGDPVNWLLNRVNMRPDMDSSSSTVEKLADSYQEAQDWSDGGWVYDQALMIIALTEAGHYTEAEQILNGLAYLQNDDGSWFFSYMTTATDEMIQDWANTDEITIYNGTECDTEEVGANGYPDELEKRVCLEPVDQIGPWIFENYTDTISPQTDTLLPDKIKYRTYDFRKFAGSNAWVVMAINYYEAKKGDSSYRQMALDALEWLETYRDTDPSRPSYGAIAMGRVWSQALVTETHTSTYGFVEWPVYVAEHNFDAYSAFLSMGRLTGDDTYTQTAELIEDFLLRELWAPRIDLGIHEEITITIDNFFFPGINMSDKYLPQGKIDTECTYLDGQSWSNLALGPKTPVLDKDGMTATLEIALDYAHQTFLITNTTIFSGTGFEAAGIDGYQENICPDKDGKYEGLEGLVWSEGSEGMVAAQFLSGVFHITRANYYHTETFSYMMLNGGVPYSTLPANPDDPFWTWTDAPSIAGTTWFVFNEPMYRVNPFQPWTEPPEIYYLFLPVIIK